MAIWESKFIFGEMGIHINTWSYMGILICTWKNGNPDQYFGVWWESKFVLGEIRIQINNFGILKSKLLFWEMGIQINTWGYGNLGCTIMKLGTICKQIWLFNLILIFNTPYIQKYFLTTINTRSFVCNELNIYSFTNYSRLSC